MERKPFEQRFNELKKEFQKWEPTFKDLAKYIDPERGFFSGQQPNKGDGIDHKTLLDETPTLSCRTFSAGMQAGITSPGKLWLKMGVPDPDLEEFEPVRYWLEQIQQRIFAICAKSNFYDVTQSVYEELGVFNTGAAIIEEDYRDVIRGRAFTIGEYYIGTDHNGRVDTFARAMQMTARQMIKMFGKDKVSQDVRTAYDTNNLHQWFEVYHLVEPNNTRNINKKDSKNMEYISVYWEKGSPEDTFLRVSGYQEFPFFIPRSSVIASNIYGTNGPGRLALGASKELQHATKKEMLTIDKFADPPVQRPAGVDLVNSLPGGVTTYGQTEQSSIKPLYQISNPYIDVQELRIQRLQNNIKRCFYEDLFLMLAAAEDPVKTAYEVSKKYEEKLVQLSPLLERVFSELRLAVDRIFNIGMRTGVFPLPPQELQGLELKVEFISSLAQAQRMIGITPIEQTAMFVGSLAKIFPNVTDKFNANEAVDQYANMAGVSPKIIRSDEEVDRILKAREQKMNQQMAIQNSLAIAQGAKTLSETDTQGSNALTSILGS